MAGFSLGGGGANRPSGESEQQQQNQPGIQPETLFHLYNTSNRPSGSSASPTFTSRGFELWQSHQLQIERHHHEQHHHQLYPPSGALLAFSDEPILGDPGRTIGFSMRGSGSSSGSGSMSCQDCGNQAKKDCSHMRCRTCCKSRGFHCSTHVKSTWVPASKRRERQQHLATAATLQQQSQQPVRIGSSEASKRPREILTAPRLHTELAKASSSGDALSFPGEVSSPAVFRCVRVSSMDDAEDQYAYQTAVNIGGHLFKGILYDHGPEGPYSPSASTPRGIGESSSSAAAVGIATAGSIGTGSASVASTAGLIDPASLYPAPLSAFMAGTQFFPHHQRPS